MWSIFRSTNRPDAGLTTRPGSDPVAWPMRPAGSGTRINDMSTGVSRARRRSRRKERGDGKASEHAVVGAGGLLREHADGERTARAGLLRGYCRFGRALSERTERAHGARAAMKSKCDPGHGNTTARLHDITLASTSWLSLPVEQAHRFRFHGLGRAPLADPDAFESYEPGLWWAEHYYANQRNRMLINRLLIPMDSRTFGLPGVRL